KRVRESPVVEGLECGKSQLRRLISDPRFRQKDQAWNETDFKKDKQRNLLSSDGEPPKEKASDKAATADTGSKDSGKAAESSKPAKEAKKETKAPASD